MNSDHRDRLIEICRENHDDIYGDIQPSSWEDSADSILAEFYVLGRHAPE